MSLLKYNEFIRALLFGHAYYEIPNHIYVQQMILDVEKYVNVKETIQNGGLLFSVQNIERDFQSILQYLKECNEGVNEPEPVKLKTILAKNFFHELSILCQGDLKLGIVAKTHEKQIERNLKTLDDAIRNESFIKLPLLGLENIAITNSLIKKAMILYDLKCKSLGRLVDPFSLILAFQQDYVDSIHWKTEESLVSFCEHAPRNPLVIQISNIVKSTIYKFLNGEQVSFLPIELNKFLQNINYLNDRIEKVESKYMPPKLIDLFQRMLAMLKMDYLWSNETVTMPTSKTDFFIVDVFNRNIELERENALLKNIISSKKI